MCVFFGSLGWPFLYLKLWTKYGFIVLAFFLAPTGCSAALRGVAEDQTHISSRGILQQPKVFVLDETFFVSKILTGCCFMPPSLSTFEVKLITSFIWFVHWTKNELTWRNWLVRLVGYKVARQPVQLSDIRWTFFRSIISSNWKLLIFWWNAILEFETC